MKDARGKKEPAGIRLPRADASYTELDEFFDRHDGMDLLDRGIAEIDPDRADLDRMLLEYWKQPNSKQFEHPHSTGCQAHDRKAR
jgi:hypothetical protein